MSVREFRRWRRYMAAEPTAADRLEFWLIQLFTLTRNLHRGEDDRAIGAAEIAAIGVDLASALPDRWGDRKRDRFAGWLTGKALGDSFKSSMAGRVKRPKGPKGPGKPGA